MIKMSDAQYEKFMDELVRRIQKRCSWVSEKDIRLKAVVLFELCDEDEMRKRGFIAYCNINMRKILAGELSKKPFKGIKPFTGM